MTSSTHFDKKIPNKMLCDHYVMTGRIILQLLVDVHLPYTFSFLS